MAGSFNHVIKKDTGELRSNKGVCDMLESYSGDVFEAVEEMYGMIWYLATAQIDMDTNAMDVIEEARQNYKVGLSRSPTRRYK